MAFFHTPEDVTADAGAACQPLGLQKLPLAGWGDRQGQHLGRSWTTGAATCLVFPRSLAQGRGDLTSPRTSPSHPAEPYSSKITAFFNGLEWPKPDIATETFQLEKNPQLSSHSLFQRD